MSALKRLVSQTATYGVSSILARLINYLLTPFITYISLRHEYGLITELYTYAAFINIVLTFGLETTYFHFSQKNFDKKSVFSNISIIVLLISISFLGITFLSIDYIAETLHYSHKEYIVYFALICVFDAASAIPFSLLRLNNQVKKFVKIRFTNIILNVVLVFYFLLIQPFFVKTLGLTFFNYLSFGKQGIGYVFISNLIASFITFLMLMKEYKLFRLEIDFNLMKKILKYTFPLLLIGILGTTNEQLSRVLYKHVAIVPEGIRNSTRYLEGQLGIFGACYKLSILIALFIQSFRYAAEPFFFSEYAKTKNKNIFGEVMKYFVICGLLIFLFVALYLDILKYFINAKFHSGLHIVVPLLLANLFLGIGTNFSVWYKLEGKTFYGIKIAFVGAVITIISNLILIPIFDYTGAAYTTLLCYFITMCYSYYLENKHFKINYNMPKLFFYFVAALILFFISVFLKSRNLYLNFFVNSLLMLSYLGTVFLFEPKIKQLITSKLLKPNRQNDLN